MQQLTAGTFHSLVGALNSPSGCLLESDIPEAETHASFV